MEIEKITAYWNIGKHIHEHLLNNQDRVYYGDYVFKTLIDELDIGRSTLYRPLQFFETYPDIVGARRQLTWTYYRFLLVVKDEEKRKGYEQRVIEEDLSARELKTLINEDHGSKLYTYKGFIKEIIDGDTLCVTIELGFNTWTTKKVRLRGINAAPVETPPGKKIKKFISDQFRLSNNPNYNKIALQLHHI